MRNPVNKSEETTASKSQKKREMAALRDLAARLTRLPENQTQRIPYPEIRESIETARKITKGNARKRQIQYLTKQLNTVDLKPITDIVDRLDASSAAYVQQFHQLESWREMLLQGSTSTLEDICQKFPHTDRQHLRALVRNAIAERKIGEQQTQFRKVFQYLKQLSDD